MHINLDFLAGFLSYGLLELLLTIVIVRYFPSKVSSLYGIGAAIQRTFSKKPVYSDTTEEEETYNDGRCGDCACYEDHTQDDSDCRVPIPEGTEVIVNSDEDSYGVSVLPIDHSIKWVNGIRYYFMLLERTISLSPDDVALIPENGLIPEGTAVNFILPECGHHVHGVTFKAIVREGTLDYVIEYPDDDDIQQVEVSADDVWKREPEKPTLKDIEADIAKNGYDEPPVFGSKEEAEAWAKTPSAKD